MSSKTALVIFLHGIGGSGSSMSPIAAAWRASMPEVAFAAPDAPFPYPHGAGHQWFGVDGRELQPDRIKSVRDAFDRIIEKEVARHGMAMRRVGFVGVSQGAIVGLDAVASGRWQVGALVSIAGLLPPIPISRKVTGTPLCLIHGELDQTISADETLKATKRLFAAGATLESHIVPAIGHTVSQEELDLARAFLKRTLLS